MACSFLEHQYNACLSTGSSKTGKKGNFRSLSLCTKGTFYLGASDAVSSISTGATASTPSIEKELLFPFEESRKVRPQPFSVVVPKISAGKLR